MYTVEQIRLSIDNCIGKWAPQLHVASAPALNPGAALKALTWCETTYGQRWAASKHENAYCYGGPYYVGDGPGGGVGDDTLRELSSVWGCSAHESWGPWQLLFITAYEQGYRDDPVRLRVPEVSVEWVVKILNKRLLDKVTDATPEDVADAWNSGRARDKIVPQAYITEFMEHYRRLLL